MTEAAPRAPKKANPVTRHGVTKDDPYAWLKDPNWQTVLKHPEQLTAEIRAYLDAENAYTKKTMAPSEAFQAELFQELKARMKEDDASVPMRDGAFAYYHRYTPGHQYPTYYRKPSAGGAESTVLDLPRLAEGFGFFKVPTVRHSSDHKLIGYTVDSKGSERYEIRFQDAATGKALPDVITDASSSFVWANDNQTVYYCVLDHNQRAKWVRRHRLGTPVANDETLYEEKDDGFFLGLSRTSSRRFIKLTAFDHTCTEAHVLSADDPKATFRCLEPRRPGVIYHVVHHDEQFIISLHAGAEKDGRLMTAPVATPGAAHWRELLPYQAGRLIEDVMVFKHHLVRLEQVDALPRIVVRALATGAEHTVDFTEEAYDVSLSGSYEFDTPLVRFVYSSMTTPMRTFDYDMTSRARTLLKEQEIPSGHRPEDYEVKRLTCTARDGVQVPITLLRHKTACKPGGPLLLYGYGSYGRSMPANFNTNRFSLVNRGVAYAIAHIRGGKEKGYAWYEDTKVLNKKRTFHDFIDVGEHLVKTGVTTRGKIVAHGGSAGGMLMGVVANMAPDLFRGIVADVPFVDVLNTMWDKDLPLTPPEWPEWGNPITSKEAHDYIASYSPYDNVSPRQYPNMLVLAGLTDPRVTYWEPAKWVARLREVWQGKNLLLLDVNMGAGHGGASGRFDLLKKVALIYAFALQVSR